MFEKRGIATVSLISKYFEGLAIATAKGRGMAALRQLILPWPYDETLPEAQVQAIARRAFDDAVQALTVPGKGVLEIKL